MKKTTLIAALVAMAFYPLGTLGQAATGDASGALATFNRAVASFNRNDQKGWVATCASPASIIDEIPPHAWSGASACSDWWSSYESYVKTNHLSDGSVTLGKPWHLTMTGTTAYIVCPATFSYKQNGKAAREAGIFTIAMTKASGQWLMSGWSWTSR
jgi:hypothetical protein